MPSIDRLIRAELYAYRRWQASLHGSEYWRRLAAALCARIHSHPDYTGGWRDD